MSFNVPSVVPNILDNYIKRYESALVHIPRQYFFRSKLFNIVHSYIDMLSLNNFWSMEISTKFKYTKQFGADRLTSKARRLIYNSCMFK